MSLKEDPFLLLYQDVQEIWNIKKGLSWSRNNAERKRIIKRLQTFADGLKDREQHFKNEIEMLKKFHI